MRLLLASSRSWFGWGSRSGELEGLAASGPFWPAICSLPPETSLGAAAGRARPQCVVGGRGGQGGGALPFGGQPVEVSFESSIFCRVVTWAQRVALAVDQHIQGGGSSRSRPGPAPAGTARACTTPPGSSSGAPVSATWPRRQTKTGLERPRGQQGPKAVGPTFDRSSASRHPGTPPGGRGRVGERPPRRRM